MFASGQSGRRRFPALFRIRFALSAAAAAALLSSLPGIWTVGLGKALRRLNRMEELL